MVVILNLVAADVTHVFATFWTRHFVAALLLEKGGLTIPASTDHSFG